MDLKIYIPTIARASRQVALKRLPPALQKKVFLVCPPDEAAQHAGSAIVLPCKEQGIAATRDWIMRHAKKSGFKRIVMIDDDVTIQRRRKQKLVGSGFNRISDASHEEIIQAMRWLDDKLKQYAHASFAPRFLENDNDEQEIEGKRAMYLLGYDVDLFFKAKAGFAKGLPPMPTMEDFNVTLQLLKAGYPNIISLEWRVSVRASNASGGCSTWRTLERHNASARRMVELHKPFVQLRRADTLWRGHTEPRLEVTIQWQKAMAFGLEARR